MHELSPAIVTGRADAAFILLDIAEGAPHERRNTLVRSVEQLSNILLTEARFEQRIGREWSEAKDLVSRLQLRVAGLVQKPD